MYTDEGKLISQLFRCIYRQYQEYSSIIHFNIGRGKTFGDNVASIINYTAIECGDICIIRDFFNWPFVSS